MIRWTLLLCAGLFCSMLGLGRDVGQERLGLREARNALSTRNTVAPVADVVDQAVEPLAKTDVTLAFAPKEPLIAAPDLAETKPPDTVSSAAGSDFPVLYVKTNRANLRSGPGKEFDVRAKLTRGQAVQLVPGDLGQGDWVLVRTEKERGYISASLLTDKAP